MYNLVKCTNHETCAILHRFHILFISLDCGSSIELSHILMSLLLLKHRFDSYTTSSEIFLKIRTEQIIYLTLTISFQSIKYNNNLHIKVTNTFKAA